MTLEDRIERGRRLCEKLQAEVEAIQSCYLATSPEKRELLSGLDADFLIMLTAWEATGEERDRLRVRDAYLAVTDAWKAVASSPLTRPAT